MIAAPVITIRHAKRRLNRRVHLRAKELETARRDPNNALSLASKKRRQAAKRRKVVAGN